MSSIDDRIVNMQFNNANFEKGVRESLNSIKNLEVSLKSIDGQSVSFDQIQNAVNSLKLDDISTSASAIANRFDTMGIIGMTAISKLTSSVMDLAGGALVSLKNKVTAVWDAIAGGGMQRAQNIEQAKFTIEGLGKAWDDVADSIDYAVSDTAYGLDEAAIAASQFLATGVETGDKMTRSLTAISGLSAMTNSSYSDMARIMTTIAGNGRVMANELNQIGARGVNAAATLRDYFNRTSESMEKYRKLYNETKSKTQEPIAEGAKLTEQNVRDMVSKGVIDFQTFSDAMYEAFGEHAKDAQETFSGASANVTAALKRIGADFQSVTISSEDYKKTLDETGKVDFTKETFNQINVLNQLRDVLKGLQTELRNSGIVKGFTDIYHAISRGMTFFLNGFMDPLNTTSKVLAPELREALVNIKGAIENVVGFVVGIASSVSAAWHTIFPESLNQTILSITEGIKSFTDMFPRVSDISGTISEMFGLTGFDTSANTESTNTVVENANAVAEAYNGVTGSLKDLVAQVINGDWGNGQERIDALGDSYDQIQDSVNSCYDSEWRLHEDWIDNIDDTIMVGQELNETLNDTAQAEASAKRVDDAYNKIKDTVGNIIPGVKDSETAFEGLRVVLEGVFSAIDMVRKAVMGAIEIVRRFVLPVAARIGEVFFTIVGTIASWVTALNKALPSHSSFIKGLDGISKILEPLWSIFYKVTQGIIDFFKALRPGGDPLGFIKNSFTDFLSSVDLFGLKVSDIPEKIGSAFSKIGDRVSSIGLPNGKTVGDMMHAFIDPILSYFGGLPKSLDDVVKPVTTFFSSLSQRFGEAVNMNDASLLDRLAYFFEPVVSVFQGFKEKIEKALEPIVKFLKPIASAIKNAIIKVFSPVIDAFKDFKNRLTQGENPIDILRSQFENFLESLGPVGSAISRGLETIGSAFKGFIDSIVKAVDSANGDPLKAIRNIISTFADFVKSSAANIASSDILSNIKKVFTGIITALGEGFESVKEFLKTTFTGVKDFLKQTIEEIAKFIGDMLSTKTAEAAEGDGLGIGHMADSLDNASDQMAGPVDRFISILEKLNYALNNYGAAIIVSIGAIVTALAVFKALNIAEIFAKSFENFSKVPAQFAKLIEEVTVSLKAFRKAVDFAIVAEGIKSLAISLGILAAIVIVLGSVPWQTLAVGGAALLALGVGIAALAKVCANLGKIEADLKKAVPLLLGIAAAIAIVAGSLAMLSRVAGNNTDAFEEAFAALIIITAALYGMAAACKKFAENPKDMIAAGAAIIEMAVAIGIVSAALYALSTVASQDLAAFGIAAAAIAGIAIALGVFGAVCKVLGKDKDILFGATAILELAVAIGIIAVALALLTQVADSSGFMAAIAVLIGVAVAIGVLMKVAQGATVGAALLDAALMGIAAVILSFGITAVLMAVAVNLIVSALERLSQIGNDTAALTGIITFINALAECAPQLLVLAGIFVVMGIGMALVGVGALLLGAGMLILAVAMLIGAAAIVAFVAGLELLTGFLESGKLDVINSHSESIKQFCDILIEVALALVVFGVGAIVAGAGLIVLGAGIIVVALGFLLLSAAVYLGSYAIQAFVDALTVLDAFLQTGAIEQIASHAEAFQTFAGVLVVVGLALVVFGAGALVAGVGGLVLAAAIYVASGAIIAFSEAILIALANLTAAVPMMQNLGQMIIQGLVNGLQSGIGSVVGAITNVAQGLMNGFMSLLGIHSPSTWGQNSGLNIDQGLANGIQQGSGGVQNAMSGVGNELMNTLTSFIPGMENTGKEAGEAGASGVSNGWMDQLSQAIGGGDFDLTKLPEGMNIDQFTNMVSSAGSNSGTAFGQSYSKSSAQAIAENSASAEEAVAAVDSIADAAQAEVDARFPEIGKSAMDKLREGFQNTDLGTAITESITQSFESVNTVGTELANNIKTGIESVDLTAVGTESAERYMTGFDTIKERITTVGTDAATAFKSGIEVIDLTAVGMQSGTQYSQGLTASLLQAMSIGVQFANNVKLGIMSVSMTDAGSKVAVDFANGLRSNSGSMRGAGALLGNAVRDGAASANLSSVGAQKGQQFASGVMMAFGAATSAGRSLANAAVAGAMVSNMRSAGIYNGQLFASGIITASGMASSAGSALANAARNGAWSNAGGMYEVGAYMSEGFAAGIEANVWRAAAAAATLAVIAQNVIALKLAIQSPSRVMMELGGYVTEGFAIGIGDNTSMVSDAATSVADSALETMSDVVSSIMDVLDIDSDMSPTITPVLDTSSVERGMNQIDSMFGDRQLNNSYAMGLASGMSGFAPSTGISETSLAKAIAEEFIKADTRPNVDATFIVNDVDNPQRFARDTMHKVAQLQRAR